MALKHEGGLNYVENASTGSVDSNDSMSARKNAPGGRKSALREHLRETFEAR